ncbi:PGPGW domain-containing protein [Kitasatospora sp. NPDC088391]|uniref:PGPGW domain-containing protein n=1 Tax=Kitasatospora sp. NPDC088391 TaxID=3364074 RepID=UPI0038077708
MSTERQRPGYEADPATAHPVARVAFGVAGTALIAVGVVLLVLPGPGMLLILAGMVLVARAVPAFARFVEPVRAKAMQGVEASVASGWRIAGSLLAGLGLIAAGVAAGLLPDLPLAGWATGASLILSGLILLGLLAWSHRRVHGPGRSA